MPTTARELAYAAHHFGGYVSDRRLLAPHPATQEAAALRQTGAAPLRSGDPRRVGPYVPVALLGSGGMGRVYLSRLADDGPGLFAVKVIRPEYAEDPPFRRRFAREALVHDRVRTPRTPELRGTGFQDELLWMATAYLPALDLAESVKEDGPLALPAVWRLVAELGGALVDLEATGIVHRDLKPSNVLLSLHGVHLIDFGIAKALAESSITGTGARVGTPAYMSPEYLRTGECSPASDLFSLAGTLAYAVTGRAPFGDGTGVDVMHRVAFEQPNAEVMGEVEAADPELTALLLRCLAKEPRLRPDPGALVEAAADHSDTSAAWPEPLNGRVLARQAAYDVLHCLPAERVAGLRAVGGRPALVSLAPPAPSASEPPTPASADGALPGASGPAAAARLPATEVPFAECVPSARSGAEGAGQGMPGPEMRGRRTSVAETSAPEPPARETSVAETSAPETAGPGSSVPEESRQEADVDASVPEKAGPPATRTSARALFEGPGARKSHREPGTAPDRSDNRAGVRAGPVLLGAAAGVALCVATAGVFLAVRPDGAPPLSAPEVSATTSPRNPATTGTGAARRDDREGGGSGKKVSGDGSDVVHGDDAFPDPRSPAPSASRGGTRSRGSTGAGGGSSPAPDGGTTSAPRPAPSVSGGPAGATTPTRVTECTYYKGSGRTRRGDEGKKVLQVQCILTERGYSVGSGGVNGVFDAGTEAAVRDFQSSGGLAADGVVGRSTWVRLRATA